MKYSFAAASFALLAVLAIAPSQTAQAQNVTTIRYRCDDGEVFRAEYFDDYAVVGLIDEDEVYTLPEVPSDSGTRYSNGPITLMTDGDAASVEIDDTMVYEDCDSYRIGSAAYTESESITIIEQQTIPDYDRPVLDYDRPPSVTASPAPAPAPEPEPVRPNPQPVVVPGLW